MADNTQNSNNNKQLDMLMAEIDKSPDSVRTVDLTAVVLDKKSLKRFSDYLLDKNPSGIRSLSICLDLNQFKTLTEAVEPMLQDLINLINNSAQVFIYDRKGNAPQNIADIERLKSHLFVYSDHCRVYFYDSKSILIKKNILAAQTTSTTTTNATTTTTAPTSAMQPPEQNFAAIFVDLYWQKYAENLDANSGFNAGDLQKIANLRSKFIDEVKSNFMKMFPVSSSASQAEKENSLAAELSIKREILGRMKKGDFNFAILDCVTPHTQAQVSFSSLGKRVRDDSFQRFGEIFRDTFSTNVPQIPSKGLHTGHHITRPT